MILFSLARYYPDGENKPTLTGWNHVSSINPAWPPPCWSISHMVVSVSLLRRERLKPPSNLHHQPASSGLFLSNNIQIWRVYMIQTISWISFQVRDVKQKHAVNMTSLIVASPVVRSVLTLDFQNNALPCHVMHTSRKHIRFFYVNRAPS